jgi:hypothetical protein
MLQAKKHTGGCHCGKVRYEVTTDLAKLMDCNCSICSKKAHILTFVGADAFTLLKGEDAVTDYQFNKHAIHHVFCSTCGIQSYSWGTGSDGKKMFSVNVRCLDGVDLASLPTPTHFDGRSR